MGSLAQPAPLGVALAACAVLAAALLVVVRRRRAAAEAQQRLDAELARSRAEVESLSRRVQELSEEVLAAREVATAAQQREYVITSLGHAEPSAVERLVLPSPLPSRLPSRPTAKVAEEQLVTALARQRDGSPLRARAVDLVVRTVALGHGVRRALSADVLDRAAAEAHVARRRSRRDRKREVREARRLLRAVRAQRPAREDAA